ncbi:malonyl -acyl carrier transacylase [Micractinium conductrix]|uniref:Malonyl -acyl carrier transacylase n=1 Tax=Micractinium conductrix TaxID=554055 RepID=A0A2P6V9U4_9CHLO|nr:malonyl -acyl carrier transacylase [Micractinium conductrix]|eukprot:PSC70866.1 malonyl -acyl carrier transacylase [Micractinium conductrix]
MPRDMTATGRYPPVPWHPPIHFYSSVRLGDPEQLAKIMDTDPYFVTQDNGAGAPIHFATTYRQLDMIHHLLNNGAEINQRDPRGFTPLHRAAYLAHYDGYLEIYEYLLSRGADPSLKTEDYDPYLNPGCKLPVEVATEDDGGITRARLLDLEKKYADVPKARVPHPDIGCWWTLYDYGPERVKAWEPDYKHPYPEALKRSRDAAERKKEKQEKKKARAAAEAEAAEAPARPSVPATPIAFLFPGQGSQAVGMLKESADIPAVRKMLETAEKVLGYDLAAVCNEGPKEKLDDTVFSQPALFVAGLAAVERLRAQNAGAVDGASACAGLSLGEYTALVFAGALSFEDGLKVVKVRAESMAAAAKLGKPHGMLSVVGLSDADLESICAAVRGSMPGAVCQLANFLFPQGRVVSGHKDALEEVQRQATAKGALKAVPVAVSGAFHTSLMQPAREALEEVLASVTISDPRIPVYSNVTGLPFKDAAHIREMLPRQLVEPVQWEGTVRKLVAAGKNQLHELGPGQQIKAMVKRIDNAAWQGFKNMSA